MELVNNIDFDQNISTDDKIKIQKNPRNLFITQILRRFLF